MLATMSTDQPALRGVDPFYLAHCRFRRRRYDDCITICTQLLADNPYDKAVWLLKCQAFAALGYVDDTELEEQGIADLLLDDNKIASVARPGTSLSGLARLDENSSMIMPNQSVRPVSSATGRPLTGFMRPGTKQLAPKTPGGSLQDAFKGARPGTSRPVTTLGRQVRLGTASMHSHNVDGPFIDVARLDMRKYAARPCINKALCAYLIHHEHNPIKALELASEATSFSRFGDWWWKLQLGKCYYTLNLLREAEQQLQSAIREQPNVECFLHLGKVYLRMDQPKRALEVYGRALEHFPTEIQVLLAVGRTHEALQDLSNAMLVYKQVLNVDPSCVEAIANLACHAFYTDQPEVSLRYYRRLVQMGAAGPELWNNLGLCCFYAGQHDLAISCFDRALNEAQDEVLADVWFNIGQVAIAIADVGLSLQALKVAVSIEPTHAAAHNNIALLELRRNNIGLAASSLDQARRHGPHMYEPYFNSALVSLKRGELQESFTFSAIAKDVYPGHTDTDLLLEQLGELFGC